MPVTRPNASVASVGVRPVFINSAGKIIASKVAKTLADRRIAVLHDTAAYSVLSKYQQEKESGIVIVTYAAYYDMLVAVRAGSVDAACLPRTMALSYRDKGMALSNYALGAVDYHVIGTSEQKDLIALIDSQLITWANDGTFRQWYEAYDLVYDLS